MRRELFQVDAFTDTAFAGNPAGVVLNAEGMGERDMLAVAREVNASETAFVFSEPGDGYDIRVRFFTPTREVPICGHATIAAHYALAIAGCYTERAIVQRTGAGDLPVSVRGDAGGLIVTMTQGAFSLGAALVGEERASLLGALGLGASALDGRLPVQIASTGYSKVMVPIADKDALNAMSPRYADLVALSARIGCNGYYVFTFDSREPGVLTAARMFAPASGVNEDPVTGNAAGPLGGYLSHYGMISALGGKADFVAAQGEAMGRKGYISVSVDAEGDAVKAIRLSGTARIVFRTSIEI